MSSSFISDDFGCPMEALGGEKGKIRNTEARVNEILGNHIPNDEAQILSNGRITCLMCVHRPIFDTIAVLVSHRRGKKHASELNKFLRRKSEIDFKKLKQKQMLESRSSSTSQILGGSSKITKFKRKAKLELPVNNLDKCKTSHQLGELNSYLADIKKKPSFKKSLIKIKESYGPVPSKKPSNKTDYVQVNHVQDVKANVTKICDSKSEEETGMHM